MKISNHLFYGRLVNGKVVPSNRKVFDQTLAQYEDGPIVIEIKREKKIRSLEQNNFYWGVVLKTISIETGHHESELHDLFKQYLPKKFLVFKRNRNPENGQFVTPYEKTVAIAKSTTELSTVEFSEYVERIRSKMADFGIIIPEAEGGKQKLNKDVSEVINSSYNDDYDPSKCVI